MSKAKLGDHISLDVSRLIETRMLVQANSGGGKSWAIRKLLEETHGKAQQIVLDMEGEFGTLREKFDYILAGKGGDVDANPKTAEILARKVLELEVSLIVDLYELKKPERIRFVKLFLDALVNAPKDLWHPVIIVIDEAHIFAPEKGESAAADAVADLATRGRKRGFACVLATQRLAKLNKDVAAECLNKMIGRTSLDIDRKRAADELGFLSAKDSLTLRKLEPGQFYAFGPAISDEVVLGRIGPVVTTHPKAGQRLGFKRTKPTDAIKSVLKKLTDLPKEAEHELKEKEDFKARIKELETELRSKPKAVALAPVKPIIQKITVPKGYVKKAVARMKADTLRLILNSIGETTDLIHEELKEAHEASYAAIESHLEDLMPKVQAPKPEIKVSRPMAKPYDRPQGFPKKEVQPKELDEPASELGACERKILGFLFAMPSDQSFTKVQIGAMTGYRHSSGGFNNALSKLSKAGLIERERGGNIRLSDAEVSHLVDSTPHTLADWIKKLGACERAIYEKILETPAVEWSKDQLGEETGYRSSSGGFNNALARLNTLGLIERQRGGTIRLNPEVQGLR